LASILTGAPVVDAPARLLFYGTRSLSANASATMSYSYSNRLAVRFGASGSRMQPLQTGIPRNATGIVPFQFRNTQAGADVGIDYSLNPRTNLSWSANSNRVFSTVSDAYNHQTTLTASRMMGFRWFAQGRGGVGIIQPVGKSSTIPSGLRYVAGGGLGHRWRSHTFLAQVDRSLSNSLAIGAGSGFSSNGDWNWHRFGSPWSVNAGYGRATMDGIGTAEVRSWRAHAAVIRRIGRQMMLQAEYVRAGYTGGASLTPEAAQLYRINLSGVRMSLMWTPFTLLPRR
jgi:hypothetical protein